MKPANEELYVRSLDTKLTPSENTQLQTALLHDVELIRLANQYQTLRRQLRPVQPPTFGTFFAESVIQQIKNLRNAIDYQVVLFFRRYHLAAWGLLVALLIVNLALAEHLSFTSVMGLEETTADEILTFDFFNDTTH